MRIPPRHDGMQLLGAELLKTVGPLHLLHGESVVEAHVGLVAVGADLDSDVSEAVELGPGLADLGGEELVVPDDPVAAERPAGRGGGNADDPLALAEHRHAGVVLVAELVGLAFLDHCQCPHHDLGLRVPVGRAGLISLTPEGVRPPGAAERRIHHVAVHPRLAGALLPVFSALGPGGAGGEDADERDGAGQGGCG